MNARMRHATRLSPIGSSKSCCLPIIAAISTQTTSDTGPIANPQPAMTQFLPSSASLFLITIGRNKHAAGSASFIVIRNTYNQDFKVQFPPLGTHRLKRLTESDTEMNHHPLLLA